jgi:hypothetical protein
LPLVAAFRRKVLQHGRTFLKIPSTAGLWWCASSCRPNASGGSVHASPWVGHRSVCRPQLHAAGCTPPLVGRRSVVGGPRGPHVARRGTNDARPAGCMGSGFPVRWEASLRIPGVCGCTHMTCRRPRRAYSGDGPSVLTGGSRHCWDGVARAPSLILGHRRVVFNGRGARFRCVPQHV